MITVAIPSYNSKETIDKCLEAIGDQYPILIIDNESTDGAHYRAHSHVKRPGILLKREHIGRVRRALAQACYTEHILYLDADIVFGESIEPLLHHLSDEVGMVGYCIEGDRHHLQMGNALLKTSLARAIDWSKFPDECNCLNAMRQLKETGLRTMQLPSTKVKHLGRK